MPKNDIVDNQAHAAGAGIVLACIIGYAVLSILLWAKPALISFWTSWAS